MKNTVGRENETTALRQRQKRKRANVAPGKSKSAADLATDDFTTAKPKSQTIRRQLKEPAKKVASNDEVQKKPLKQTLTQTPSKESNKKPCLRRRKSDSESSECSVAIFYRECGSSSMSEFDVMPEVQRNQGQQLGEDEKSESENDDFIDDQEVEDVFEKDIGEEQQLPLTEVRTAKNSRIKKKQKGEMKGPRNTKFCTFWIQVKEFKGWLSKSQVIRNGNEYAYCEVCKMDIIAHRNDIKRHSLSLRLKKKISSIASNTKITDMVVNNPLNESPLLENLFPDSKIAKNISLKRTKATAMLKQGLGVNFREQLFSKIRKPGNFFSFIVDETTDRGSIKQCCLVIIYFCYNDTKVVTEFFDLFELGSGKAADIYAAVKNSIISKNIPFDNLIGFSADTCNVMFGEYNSVYLLLKKDLPHSVSIKCSCHSIHLASSYACRKLPRSVEDLLRNIGSHFGRSFSRQEKFREFQLFFKVAVHKILSPAITRWLSLKACVDRVLEQYDALEAYLRVLCVEDPSRTNDDMLHTMTNKFTKMYLEFMSYTLGILTEYNTLFQSESPLLHNLKPETEKLLKDICSNFLNMQYIRNNNVFTLDHTNP
ncbi:unnamed protein product [Brassicogethes aeneus]|uniref:DUF4371 domain-containing protein n=1 Tax=Brassicogethes aeneus TaxID=1431903 RepID=A0A9P0FEW4_BRAAE|nr:unnamed protein product [Brassicogethes aeneus]